MLLLLVILLIVWAFSWGGPRYYPSYQSRYGWYPLWGGGSHVLLAIVLLVILLWFLGVVRF
jgi:hypothetical protein